VKLLAGSTDLSNSNCFLVKVRFCQAETSVVLRRPVHRSRQLVRKLENIELSDLSSFLTSGRNQQSDWQHFCLCACTDQVTKDFEAFSNFSPATFMSD